MYPPVQPVLIQLGPLAVRWYGILIMLGILAGAWVGSRYLKQHGENPEQIYDLLIWVMIPAVLGARLYYVFIQSPRGPNGLGMYLENPIRIFEIWQGGLHIYGALALGGLALVLYMRWRKLPTLIYLDAIGLVLPLSQAIGRQANFINQELYGPPTTLPWGLRIDAQHRVPPYTDLARYPDSTRFQPLFLYESLWNALGFGLIFWISRRWSAWLRDGDIFLIYLIWYPLGRFWLEFFRTDSWFFPGTPINPVHILSVAMIATAVAILIRRHRHAPPVGVTRSEPDATPAAAETVVEVDAEATPL